MRIYFTIFLVLFTIKNFSQWSNGQNAEYVLGEADFTTAVGGLSDKDFNGLFGIALDIAHNKLFISEYGNNRILRFNYPITGNYPTADLVLGQADFTTGAANRGVSCAANTLFSPYGLYLYGNDLWVADYGNSRILRYSNAYNISTNGVDADFVLGQSDFITNTQATVQNGFNQPFDLCIDESGNLWVADCNNNRIMVFQNVYSKSNGANADKVLGQTEFTTAASGTTANSLFSPSGIIVKNGALFVTDVSNCRVLRYDNAVAKSNGAAADGVLGQPDFSSNLVDRGGTADNNTLDWPAGVQMDNSGTLYVIDMGNSRILIFKNAVSKGNGAAADNVLGQPNFTSDVAVTTQSGLNWPWGNIAIDYSNNKILIPDDTNYRVLQFAASSALPVELRTFSANIADKNVKLNWETATEANNYGFEVERLQDNKITRLQNSNWEKIGFVAGHGNSNSAKEYSFTDYKISNGKYAYRLKQIDNDGKYEYSKEVEVEVSTPLDFNLEQNYPNPFNPSTSIKYSVPYESRVKLIVFNTLGEIVKELVSDVKATGNYEVTFNASHLSSGIYFYTLTAQPLNRGESFRSVKKLVLVK
ncbi:MAG: T9SS type A sorting domain-containing protein [Ignavibacteriaceae bacterium]|jgi:sugar lactone lactonase YvrE|nr:T9SS type A sorting domain-containing protein [Ignavibacteriaceae bacterium]